MAFEPSSSVTVSKASVCVCGMVATVAMELVVKSSLTGNATLGTVPDYCRPCFAVPLASYGKDTYLPYVENSGAVKANIVGTLSSGSMYFGGTYLLAK